MTNYTSNSSWPIWFSPTDSLLWTESIVVHASTVAPPRPDAGRLWEINSSTSRDIEHWNYRIKFDSTWLTHSLRENHIVVHVFTVLGAPQSRTQLLKPLPHGLTTTRHWLRWWHTASRDRFLGSTAKSTSTMAVDSKRKRFFTGTHFSNQTFTHIKYCGFGYYFLFLYKTVDFISFKYFYFRFGFFPIFRKWKYNFYWLF